MSPADATIGQSARERRRLIRTIAPRDESNAGSPRVRGLAPTGAAGRGARGTGAIGGERAIPSALPRARREYSRALGDGQRVGHPVCIRILHTWHNATGGPLRT